MCGINDPFNRMPFREGDESLHDYYAALAQLRNSTPVLATGQASFMAANKDVLLILRYIKDGVDGERGKRSLSCSDKPGRAGLQLCGPLPGGRLRQLLWQHRTNERRYYKTQVN